MNEYRLSIFQITNNEKEKEINSKFVFLNLRNFPGFRLQAYVNFQIND